MQVGLFFSDWYLTQVFFWAEEFMRNGEYKLISGLFFNWL